MHMHEMRSSQVHSIGHEGSVLAVRFHNSGALYHYYDVPESVFHALKEAKSAGKFLGTHIKGKYEYKRIDEKKA